MKIIRYSSVILLLVARQISAAVNLEIWPIMQQISNDKQNSFLWLENKGNKPADLQISILKWDQHDNKDIYSDQTQVVSTQPLIGILPNAKNMIRFFDTGNKPSTEQAYRIIIDEIPSNQATQENHSPLLMRMRFILPLFIEGTKTNKAYIPNAYGQASHPPHVTWNIEHAPNGQYLLLHNDSPVRARIADVELIDTKSKKVVWKHPGLLGYVLSNSNMHWKINAPNINELHSQLVVSFFSSTQRYSLKKAG